MEGSTIVLAATKSDATVDGTLRADKTIKVSALTGITSLGSLSSQTGVTLTTSSSFGVGTGSIEVNNIDTGSAGGAGGPINVIAAGGTLTVDASATISANSNKGTRASIVLQEKATKGAVNIVIGSGARITTGGTFGGNIAIAVGPTSTSKGNNLPAAAGVTFSPGNPQKAIYLGANGVDFAGGTTDVNVIGKGVKIMMNTGSLPASAITIHGGSSGPYTLIQADPPTVTPSVIGLHQPSLQSTQAPEILSAAPASITSSGRQNNPAVSTPALNFAAPQRSISGVITESELPGLVSSSQTLYGQARLTRDSESVPIENVYKGSAGKKGTSVETHVVYGSDSPEGGTFNTGSAVVVATRDMNIDTDFGTVTLRHGAIALISASADSTSVFNLDDKHKESIVISINSHKLSISPGQHLTVTRAGVNSFDLVNPEEAIAHKSLRQKHLENNIQVFSSEFSTVSAIANVGAFKDYIVGTSSSHASAVSRILKTAAILSQLANSTSNYELYPHPRIIASEK
jgi:hypothetical protein